MIKLTREVVENDPKVACRRSWVLKVTASYISEAEYEKYKEAEDAKAVIHGLRDYEDRKRAESLSAFKAMYEAAHGNLDEGTQADVPEDTGSSSASHSEDPGSGSEPEDVKIFVYHASDDDNPYHGDLFSNVASASDMWNLPVDEPVGLYGTDPLDDYIPFYRTDSMELTFRTLEGANRAWEVIKHDTRMLVREFYKGRNLMVAEEVVY